MKWHIAFLLHLNSVHHLKGPLSLSEEQARMRTCRRMSSERQKYNLGWWEGKDWRRRQRLAIVLHCGPVLHFGTYDCPAHWNRGQNTSKQPPPCTHRSFACLTRGTLRLPDVQLLIAKHSVSCHVITQSILALIFSVSCPVPTSYDCQDHCYLLHSRASPG